MLFVRNAVQEDLPHILDAYAFARQFMARNGNPTQWGDTHPPKELLEVDISRQQLYVVCDGEDICGVFAFIPGKDPTYGYIEGSWHHSDPYGTIHRIAGNGKKKGVFQVAVSFAKGKTGHIRIDTHKNNTIMQHVLQKNGFSYCGIIYLENGDPRLAYDWHI